MGSERGVAYAPVPLPTQTQPVEDGATRQSRLGRAPTPGDHPGGARPVRKRGGSRRKIKLVWDFLGAREPRHISGVPPPRRTCCHQTTITSTSRRSSTVRACWSISRSAICGGAYATQQYPYSVSLASRCGRRVTSHRPLAPGPGAMPAALLSAGWLPPSVLSSRGFPLSTGRCPSISGTTSRFSCIVVLATLDGGRGYEHDQQTDRSAAGDGKNQVRLYCPRSGLSHQKMGPWWPT